MALFGRRPLRPHNPGLPRSIVAMMERYGRFEFDPPASTDDAGSVWLQTQDPIRTFATSDPSTFVDALGGAVISVGGWAAFGGACTAWELLRSEDRHGQGYEALMTAAVDFLRRNGVPPMRVKGYLWSHWVDHGGTVDTWIPRVPTPTAVQAPITPLRAGELRRIAVLSPQPDANVVLVRLEADGTHIGVIDARQSDDKPRRTQWDWKSAASSHSLYIDVGLALQTPPHWFDPELEPYFPLGHPQV